MNLLNKHQYLWRNQYLKCQTYKGIKACIGIYWCMARCPVRKHKYVFLPQYKKAFSWLCLGTFWWLNLVYVLYRITKISFMCVFFSFDCWLYSWVFWPKAALMSLIWDISFFSCGICLKIHSKRQNDQLDPKLWCRKYVSENQQYIRWLSQIKKYSP